MQSIYKIHFESFLCIDVTTKWKKYQQIRVSLWPNLQIKSIKKRMIEVGPDRATYTVCNKKWFSLCSLIAERFQFTFNYELAN